MLYRPARNMQTWFIPMPTSDMPISPMAISKRGRNCAAIFVRLASASTAMLMSAHIWSVHPRTLVGCRPMIIMFILFIGIFFLL